MITGDGIAKLCDYEMYPPQPFKSHRVNLRKLSEANSIFVPGHMVDKFLSEFSDFINAKVLVFGNSDRDYFALNFPIPSNVKVLLIQNSHIQDDRVITLPIGLENLRYGKNGFKRYIRPSTTSSSLQGRILVGPFSPTHPDREKLTDWRICNSSNITYLDTYVNNRELSRISSEHTFVVCPRGNGTDTHRFWETLYRGSIPIVIDDIWSRKIRDFGIPCLLVPSWDFSEVQNIVLNSNLKKFNPRDVEPLWLEYWDKVIRSNSQ